MNFLQAATTTVTSSPSGNSPSPIIRPIAPQYFQFIFRGSPDGGSESVKFETVKHICGFLNPNRTPDVFFDIRRCRPMADGSFTFKGDSSTAMALDFVDRFPILAKRHFEKDPERTIVRMRLRYQSSSFVFRARQAAFNTLCKAEDCREDFYTNQLSCLLTLHHRRSKWSTRSIAVKSGRFSSKIEETFKELENGHYLIRMDQSVEKKWKEEGIHTFVLIRQGSKSFVYDPKFGCVKLTEKMEHLFLRSVILRYREIHQIETVRFFKVAEEQIICRPSEFSLQMPEIRIFREYAILTYPDKTTQRVQFVKDAEEQNVPPRAEQIPSLLASAVRPSPPSRRDRKLFGHFIQQFLTDPTNMPVPAGSAQTRLSPEVSEVE